jgi:hypothetical protein
MAMGFLKRFSLRVRAEKIANGFLTLRRQQFDGAVQLIEKRLSLPIIHRTLGGDADLALKGYQVWISTVFQIEHPYVLDSEVREFGGLLSTAVAGTDKDSVDRVLCYFQEFQECHKEIETQMCRVAEPVSDYIVGSLSDHDKEDISLFPIVAAGAMVAMLMPMFEINTKMVLADYSGNQAALRELQEEMNMAREALTRC